MGSGASSAKAGVTASAEPAAEYQRKAALTRHLMAMDRLGARMLQLEGKVDRLPHGEEKSTALYMQDSNSSRPVPDPQTEEQDDLQAEINGLQTALAQLPELEALEAPRKAMVVQLESAKSKKSKRDENRTKAEQHAATGRQALDQRDYTSAITAFEAALALNANSHPGLMSHSLVSSLESGLTSARTGLTAQETARIEARERMIFAEACMAAEDHAGAIRLHLILT